MRAEETFRYCPWCGAPNTNPSSNPFRCNQCQHVHYFSPTAAVGAIVVRNHELLFLVRNKDPGKGRYGLPGGFVDAGETLEQSLVREVSEETSLVVTHHEYLCSYPNQYLYKDVNTSVVDAFFLCQVQDDSATVIEQEEVAEFRWLEPTETVLANMAFESNRLAILHYLKRK